MNDSKISVRYAKALFQAAIEKGVAEKVMTDLKFVKTAIAVSDFREMLDSPVAKTSGKKRVFDDLFAASIDPLTLSFLHLVLDNKRESYFAAMIRNYTRMFKEHQGIRSAEIIVPSALNKEYREKLQSLLEKVFDSKIEMEEKIKPELIGGFILKVEDEQYDASVSSNLARIEKSLLKQTNAK
jgi:F-type H+-transporting ATPase subunit delta